MLFLRNKFGNNLISKGAYFRWTLKSPDLGVLASSSGYIWNQMCTKRVQMIFNSWNMPSEALYVSSRWKCELALPPTSGRERKNCVRRRGGHFKHLCWNCCGRHIKGHCANPKTRMKTSLSALSFATAQSHVTSTVFLQYSFIFGHTGMKHPVHF